VCESNFGVFQSGMPSSRGYARGYRWGSRNPPDPTSSSTRSSEPPIPPSMLSTRSREGISRITPLRIQQNLESVEVATREERDTIHDWEVDVEIGDWVLDKGASRAQDTKYHKTIDLYWHIKLYWVVFSLIVMMRKR
jgi:hypothetical protein